MSMRFHAVALMIAGTALSFFSAIEPAHAGSAEAGMLFNTHCASCHGPEARLDPDSPVVEALGVIPADFRDPLFNSREPAEDWEMVIEHGGAALGLSE